MEFILEFLNFIICLIVTIGNFVICASLTGCSFKDIKKSLCEFFENRNVFGCILNIIILIFLVPGIIAGLIFHLIVLGVKGIWYLGDKGNFPLN